VDVGDEPSGASAQAPGRDQGLRVVGRWVVEGRVLDGELILEAGDRGAQELK
jgi:hypothetical protein